MWKLWLIQLFWLVLALPGYAAVRRWDPASLERGFMFALARSYLASIALLTPVSVLAYFWHWPLWTLSAAYAAAVLLGLHALWRHRLPLPKPSWLAAVSCVLIALDLWIGLRAGAHTQGDAGYHIARVRMLLVEGLSNWDPIVAQPRLDIIYHTNWYHALIAVSAQLTGSDAALAWLATWPFAKLLIAASIAQLACSVFGAARYGWPACLGILASQVAYSAVPFPNTLAPMALVPMGLCAGAELLARPERGARAAAWLAASAVALAQLHALNAIFLAMVVGPVLAAVLVIRTVFRKPGKLALGLGLLACGASLPWLLVAGGPRIEALLADAAPMLRSGTPPSAAATREREQATAAAPKDREEPREPDAAPTKVAYKTERFRKLPNGLSVFEAEQLRGTHDTYTFALLALLITLALRPPKQLAALAAFVAMTCAWLLVPRLCTLLLFVTGAPWAALRVSQLLPLALYTLLPAAVWFWITRLKPVPAPLQPVFVLAALALGWSQSKHGEPWTLERVWQHARDFEAETQWDTIAQRQALLCGQIPQHETVMAHVRWDYGLPMHCRSFSVALAPGRGWHGMPYMDERRADVDEFFRDGTSGPRRLALMDKYALHYVYTSQRLARRITASLPKQSRILAESRAGAVLKIDP
jgi:hypothetical protein